MESYKDVAKKRIIIKTPALRNLRNNLRKIIEAAINKEHKRLLDAGFRVKAS